MRFFLCCFIIFSFVDFSRAQVMNPMGPSPKNYEDEKEEKPSKKFDPQRLVFGGNLGLSFGDFTFINISPQVGYQFSNSFIGGAGINYISNSIMYRNPAGERLYKESFSNAGLNLFGRFFPTNFLFLMAQPEYNYSWGKVKFYNNNQPDLDLGSAWVPSFLVGGGVMTGGGERGRGGLMLSVQYDLAQDPRSPYGSRPFISMGYAF